MNKSELESKHLAELHTLAAEVGVDRYRMLSREELIEALAEGGGGGAGKPERKREPRARRESGGGGGQGRGGGRQSGGGGRERRPRRERQPKRDQPRQRPERGQTEPAEREPSKPAPDGGGERPKRRRRRRFGRRGRKTVRVQDILLPASGGQVLVYSESRAGCTSLLRELAAELSGGNGPDPVAVLVDPSPEELAEWKREAPKAEIVSAGQERHAQDALDQAVRRAGGGESVIVLIDSLSRLAETFGGAKLAKEMFDAGLSAGVGDSLTIVAALERPA